MPIAKKIMLIVALFSAYPILHAQQLYCDNFKVVGVYDFPPSPDLPGGNYFLLMLTAKEDNPAISTGYANLFFVDNNQDTISIPTGSNRHLPLYKSDTIPYTLKLSGSSSNQDFPPDFEGHLYIINSQQPDCHIPFSNQVTGVSKHNLEKHKLKIFPNPASDFFSVTAEAPISVISIYNSQGKPVKEVFPESNKVSLSIGNFSNGLYSVIIRLNDGTVKTRKIVKH